MATGHFYSRHTTALRAEPGRAVPRDLPRRLHRRSAACRLPALQRALGPFCERRGLHRRTYGALLRGWLIDNRPPHTNWAGDPGGGGAPAVPTGGA